MSGKRIFNGGASEWLRCPTGLVSIGAIPEVGDLMPQFIECVGECVFSADRRKDAYLCVES